MEEFLALLDRVSVSLRDTHGDHGAETSGQHHNLTAKEKLSANDVHAHKYWLIERGKQGTFENLVSWLEIRVQIMDETKDERRDQTNEESNEKKRQHRGVGTSDKRKPRRSVVPNCTQDHPPWVCQLFQKVAVPRRN